MKTVLSHVARAVLLVPALVLGVGFATPVLAQNCSNSVDVSQGVSQGAECAKPTSAPTNLFGPNSVFVTVTNILLFLIGAVAVIMLIVGGIRYVVSQGDQSAVTGAKNTILYAIIGIVVAFLAYAAVNFLTGQLNQGTGTGYAPSKVAKL